MPISQPAVPPRQDFRVAIQQTLGADVGLIFVSLLLGVLFSSAVGAVEPIATPNGDMLLPPKWLIFLSCSLPALLYLLLDSLRSVSNPAAMPFSRSSPRTKLIYGKRIHLLLLAFYFTSILVALCWSAVSMLLFSKLFVSAIFACALYSLGRSIPSQRWSFILSGILFLIVLVATQIFIVTRLEAEAERSNQEILNEWNTSGEAEKDAEGQDEPVN